MTTTAPSFFDRRLTVLLIDLTQRSGLNQYVQSLSRSFSYTLPLIMIGAVVLTFRDFPLWDFAALPASVMGIQWKDAINGIINGTFGLAALILLCTLSGTFSKHHNLKRKTPYVCPLLAATISLSCLFIVAPTDPTQLRTLLSLNSGLLPAILIATIASSIFLALAKVPWLQVPLGGGGQDPVIRDILKLLPAAICTILFFALLKAFALDGSLLSSPETIVQQSFLSLADNEQELSFGLFYSMLSQVFWFFGAHGPNVLFSIETTHLVPADLANAAANVASQPPQFIFTKTFFDTFARLGGSGSTLCLIAALMVKRNSHSYCKICMLALLPALFNVNEPLLFGIPLIFNPTYLIPFVLTPVIQTAFAYLLTMTGWLPHTSVSVPWTTPMIISGFLATGSLKGVAMQLLNFAVGTAIYIPFVQLDSLFRAANGKRAMDQLLKAATRCDTGFAQRKCIDLPGEVGRLAKALADDLALALKKGDQLYLVFQPQFDESGTRPFGVEALLRWKHPVYGHIPPPIAIALAEDTGLIHKLGMQILSDACSHRAAWCSRVPEDMKLAVNVSPLQLQNQGFAQAVLCILSENGIPPRLLELEISESSMVEPSTSVVESLQRLRDKNVCIAIDDFGMGHASLRYLRALPITTVKIDRSLTFEDQTSVNASVIRSIVELGHSLDIDVVVEGVEHRWQIERFVAMGCKVFQGYAFGHPMRAEDLLANLSDSVQLANFQTGVVQNPKCA